MLVIVHGDEYGWGSGGPFNGTTLASYGQIIVVTINYRLGPFGQLFHRFRSHLLTLVIVPPFNMFSFRFPRSL